MTNEEILNLISTEPNEHEWDHIGYKCSIQRHPQMLTLCGYVCVPKGHPWHGVHYDQIDVDVHGGLTFSELTENGFWIIGFDWGHLRDWYHSPYRSLVPLPQLPTTLKGTYRDFPTVKRWPEELAIQVSQVQKHE